jgi:hypothetical protein
MTSSVTKRLDEAISAATALRDVRNRLAELDEERSALESEAERLLATLAGTAANALQAGVASTPQVIGRPASLSVFVPRRSAVTLTDQIITYLRITSGEFGATELAAALGFESESQVNTIRGTLSRLAADGRIQKTGYGKYRSKQEENEKAHPVAG